VASNLIQMTDRDGRVTQYTYDNLQRQTAEKWMSGSTVVKQFTYSYDVGNQLVGVGDGTADYTYQYDGQGRQTQSQINFAALAQPVTLNQTFDAASNRTSLFAAIGSTADFKNTYGHDNLDRLTVVMQQGQAGGNAVADKRVDFGYLADGQYDQITRYADLAGTQLVAASTYGYDGAGQLTSLVHAKASTIFAGYGFTFDAASRMTAFTNSAHPSEDATYTNDATGQLTGADRTGSTDDEAYVYDENGNRVTANGDAYTTSANNRIASDGTNTYAYDAEGNITRITNIATGDYRDLTWDYRNRLVQVTQFDSSDVEQWRVEYVYDAFNRLIGRTEYTGGSSTPSADDIFIYDGYQMVLKLDASGNVESRTLWGAGVDQILATEDASGDVTWPLTDHLNTVRDIVSYDSSTDTTSLDNHIVYDSFGNVVSETNSSVASDFLFTGRYTDAHTGLQWNLNRWYVPSIGRWASEDPIGFTAGDPNLARYVGNGPTTRVDPRGLEQRDSDVKLVAEIQTLIDGCESLKAHQLEAIEKVKAVYGQDLTITIGDEKVLGSSAHLSAAEGKLFVRRELGDAKSMLAAVVFELANARLAEYHARLDEEAKKGRFDREAYAEKKETAEYLALKRMYGLLDAALREKTIPLECSRGEPFFALQNRMAAYQRFLTLEEFLKESEGNDGQRFSHRDVYRGQWDRLQREAKEALQERLPENR
jgi:RHS repeat-associated protein